MVAMKLNGSFKIFNSSKILGLDVGNSRFSFLLMFPCGRPRFWKISIFLFVDVALQAVSILKTTIFLYLLNVLYITKNFHLPEFEHQEYARTLIVAECTSQRLKWTSGARVMIIFGHFTHK